jgi:hypothetical protein
LKLKIGDSYCIVVPDHDWTLKLGRGWYGIQGYPFGTRLVLGPKQAHLGFAIVHLGFFSDFRGQNFLARHQYLFYSS